MKNYEYFNKIEHRNASAEEQASAMIEYQRHSEDFTLPENEEDIERLRQAMIDWLMEEKDDGKN